MDDEGLRFFSWILFNVMIKIDKSLLDDLFERAKESDRLRMNYDLRTSSEDNSQRMLNALLPGTVVPVHRHPMSTENVFLLCGKLVEVICEETSYENDNDNENFRLVEKERIVLDPTVGNFSCVVPAGVWHTVEVLEPSVIYETKDGRYGEGGSETLGTKTMTKTKTGEDALQSEDNASEKGGSSFKNCLGDLRKNIEYLIGMERQSGSMDAISPLYVSRMLNVPLEDVEKVMKELGYNFCIL